MFDKDERRVIKLNDHCINVFIIPVSSINTVHQCFHYTFIFYKYGTATVCYLPCYKNTWYRPGTPGNDRDHLSAGNIAAGYRKGQSHCHRTPFSRKPIKRTS